MRFNQERWRIRVGLSAVATLSFLLGTAIPGGPGAETANGKPPKEAPVNIGDGPPWPAEVPGWKAVQSGEHPRLFFRKSDLPELKRRAQTPEGKAIVARLKVLLGGGESMPTVFNGSTKAYGGNSAVKKGGDDEKAEAKGGKELPIGAYTLWHGAGFGMLYQITGEKKYADLGRQCVEKAFEGVRDRDDRYSWIVPGGALRAGPSMSAIGMAYDLCYDGWDPEFRKKVALEIQNYNQGPNMSLESCARGKRQFPACNHWGAEIGGPAICLLAIRGDPGVDGKLVETLLEDSSKCFIRLLTKGWGDHGYFAEGDGPGSISSDTSFIPAMQAWKVAGGKDFISPRPNAQWMTLKWVMLTAGSPGKPAFPLRGTYGHDVWHRTGLSGSGTVCQGFGAIPEPLKPALLWTYNHFVSPKEIDYDAVGPYPHRALLALVNWPIGVAERNPAEFLPRAVEDKSRAYYMFRNRWQDDHDVIMTALLKGSRGNYSVPGGPVILWALGKRMDVGKFIGNPTYFRSTVGGGVVGTAEASLGVDFSQTAGCDAVIVTSGLNLNVKEDGQFKTRTADVGGKSLTILTISASGKHPEVKAEGDSVTLGGQTMSLKDGNVQFAKGFEEWTPPQASAPAPKEAAEKAAAKPAPAKTKKANP